MAAILNVRLKGAAEEINALVARMSTLPGVQLTSPDLKPARYGTGFLAYFTAVIIDQPITLTCSRCATEVIGRPGDRCPACVNLVTERPST
jgi:hypothetical protein